MSDSFIRNVNLLANTIDSKIAELNSLKHEVDTVMLELEKLTQNTLDYKNQAQEIVTNAMDTIYKRPATDEEYGVVKVCDCSVYSEDEVFVPTFKALSDTINDFADSLDYTSENIKGIVRYATDEEVKNKDGDGVIRAKDLNIKLNIDATKYYTYQVINNIHFVILKIDDNTSYLQGFGRLNFANQEIKINFPKNINTSTFGIGSCLYKEDEAKVIVKDLTDSYVVLEIKSNTECFAFINMQAIMLNDNQIAEPTNVKATSVGDEVTLEWID